jgi:hypothetical protein
MNVLDVTISYRRTNGSMGVFPTQRVPVTLDLISPEGSHGPSAFVGGSHMKSFTKGEAVV